jgi:hypothetical protein
MHIGPEALAAEVFPSFLKLEKGSRKTFSGFPLAQIWERGIEGVRAKMCVLN